MVDQPGGDPRRVLPRQRPINQGLGGRGIPLGRSLHFPQRTAVRANQQGCSGNINPAQFSLRKGFTKDHAKEFDGLILEEDDDAKFYPTM